MTVALSQFQLAAGIRHLPPRKIGPLPLVWIRPIATRYGVSSYCCSLRSASKRLPPTPLARIGFRPAANELNICFASSIKPLLVMVWFRHSMLRAVDWRRGPGALPKSRQSGSGAGVIQCQAGGARGRTGRDMPNAWFCNCH